MTIKKINKKNELILIQNNLLMRVIERITKIYLLMLTEKIVIKF